jgi:DNA-binding NtrC family response regulator
MPVAVREKQRAKLATELDQNSAPPQLLARMQESRTILVVEDNALVRRATCELLWHLGHDALAATNAATARALFAGDATRIDAVICDSVLPDASGIELCAFFQRGRAQLPIILTSGYPNSPASLQKNSNTHFLGKPYSGDSLVIILERLFANQLQMGTLLPRPVAEDLQNLPG